MARLRGRAPRGQRLRAGIPHGHWKTTTFVAGLRLTGMTAPMALDGPMNREPSWPIRARFSPRRLRQATSSSWTICPPTRATRCAGPSRRPEQPSSSCRPTVPVWMPPAGHVWMPPAGQGDSAALLSRARVRSCVRPLMQPGWLRAPMSYVVQAPNQTCALWLRGGCIGLACIRLAGLSTHRCFSTLALPAAVARQLF